MQYEEYVNSRNAAGDLTGDEIFIFLQGGEAVQASFNALIDFIAESVSSVEHYTGDWAGTTAFPGTGSGGNFTGGAPARGDKYKLTAYLTVGSNGPYAPGTMIEANVDNPGTTTRADWNIYAMQL